MIDYHYETFLAVCKTLNYTLAGEMIGLTQPAVSNHISYLETQLNIKLFTYKNKKLKMTEEAAYLQEKLIYMVNYSNRALKGLDALDYIKVNLGCTLSISDYVIPSLFIDIFQKEKKFQLNALVENTDILVNYLIEGKIDAAFVEGDFNHDVFSSIPCQKATLVGICAPSFELTDKKNDIEDLFNYQLILREPGSGTRAALEKSLSNYHIQIDSFKKQTVLGSIDLIKRLVEANIGISFLFDVCVEKEVQDGTLKKIELNQIFEPQQLNFIYLSENPTTEFINKLKEKF